MDWSDLDRSFPGWFAVVAPLVTSSRAKSVALAKLYLIKHRRAARIPGQSPIVAAAPIPPEKLSIALQVTARASVKAAAGRGVAADRAMANAFVQSSGAATRLVLEGGRETIVSTVKADPRAVGMIRVTSGRACDFCDDLAAYSVTNPALQTDFQAHDHCGCTAQPVYR